MTWVQFIVLFFTILGVTTFLGGVIGLFQDRGDKRMTPDQEYEWLTGECGLTHDEALEYQSPLSAPISRSEG